MTASCAGAMYATQGPDWLACLYLHPPGWLNPALAALAGIVAIVALYRLRERGWAVDLETQREMLVIAWTVVGVLVATLSMVRWSGQPYLADVAVGVTVGWGAVAGCQAGAGRVRWPRALEGPRVRVLALWAALSVVVMVGPAAVAAPGLVTLQMGRWYLAALAVVMVIYNSSELEEVEA